MPKLLVVAASPRRNNSISRELTGSFVTKWLETYPDGEVVMRDLVADPLPFVDEAWIAGAFTAPETHSPDSAAAMRLSNLLIAELQSADHILIGTPMHNLMIPAQLKVYIDQIVRVGSTVSIENEGLVKDKKAAIIVASGGDFSVGAPAEKFNHLTPYLRTVLGFIGITDVQIVMAGPTRQLASGQQEIDKFVGDFEGHVDGVLNSWVEPRA